MTPDQARVAFDSLQGYFGVIALFGGNPCISPHFEEICKIMRGAVPWNRRGLWSNHPLGKGKICRQTFNPAVSNLNVHESQEAYNEFAGDWPESKPYLKGLDCDSAHRPPFVELNQMIPDEAERWRLIRDCKINAEWSAMIGIFRGQLRGWFCEIAGAQSMLHQYDSEICEKCGGKGTTTAQYHPEGVEPVEYPCWDCAPTGGFYGKHGPSEGRVWGYPDTGHRIVSGWWNKPIDAFEEQVTYHCHRCGIPLPSESILANGGEVEVVTLGYERIAKPKRLGRQVLTLLEPAPRLGNPNREVIRYLESGKP
jgi:hypothetical protein